MYWLVFYKRRGRTGGRRTDRGRTRRGATGRGRGDGYDTTCRLQAGIPTAATSLSAHPIAAHRSDTQTSSVPSWRSKMQMSADLKRVLEHLKGQGFKDAVKSLETQLATQLLQSVQQEDGLEEISARAFIADGAAQSARWV